MPTLFLSFADLQKRWGYSRAGVHKLAKAANFPAPFATVSNGKVKIFYGEDIEAYEQGKPWLFDEEQKRRRQRLFGLLSLAKGKPEERANVLQHAFGSGAKPWENQ